MVDASLYLASPYMHVCNTVSCRHVQVRWGSQRSMLSSTCNGAFALSPRTQVVKLILCIAVSLAWPPALGERPCIKASWVTNLKDGHLITHHAVLRLTG